MLERGKMDRNVIEMVEIDGLVPEGHLLRKIDKAVDFNRLYGCIQCAHQLRSRPFLRLKGVPVLVHGYGHTATTVQVSQR